MNPHDAKTEREILPFQRPNQANALAIAQAKQAERRREEKNRKYEAAYGGRPLKIADYSAGQQLFAMQYGGKPPEATPQLDGMNPYEVFSKFMAEDAPRQKQLWPRSALFVLAGLAMLAVCYYISG